MNPPLPYNFKEEDNGYRFQTDSCIYYNVSFSDGSFYFKSFPERLSIFEFNISVIALGDNLTPPLDRRVEATIVYIFANFLLRHENSIIYTCENLDKRQKVRHRKFSAWFKNNIGIIPDLEKYDSLIIYENLEIISSLIVHSLNPDKATVINIFLEQINEFNKN